MEQVPVPELARWLLGLGIAATLAANVAHGLGHGLIGAAVAAWPAVALVGSYELLMMVTRAARRPTADKVHTHIRRGPIDVLALVHLIDLRPSTVPAATGASPSMVAKWQQKITMVPLAMVPTTEAVWPRRPDPRLRTALQHNRPAVRLAIHPHQPQPAPDPHRPPRPLRPTPASRITPTN